MSATKIKILKTMRERDALYRNASTVSKSDRPSKEAALEILAEYGDMYHEINPEITLEKANVKAIDDLPTIAALASGSPWELAVGHY